MTMLLLMLKRLLLECNIGVLKNKFEFTALQKKDYRRKKY